MKIDVVDGDKVYILNKVYENCKEAIASLENIETYLLTGDISEDNTTATIKPLEIIKNLIINSSKENDVVLDAFMGSGTTAVACKELNRHFIGFELNPKIYSNSIKRLNEKDLFSFQGEENGN